MRAFAGVAGSFSSSEAAPTFSSNSKPRGVSNGLVCLKRLESARIDGGGNDGQGIQSSAQKLDRSLFRGAMWPIPVGRRDKTKLELVRRTR